MEETTFAEFDLFDFSSFIFKKLAPSLKKTTLQKKMLQLKKNQMVQIQMTLEIQRIHLGLCSSMRNVRISQQSMMAENLLEILTKRRSRNFTVVQSIDAHYLINAVGGHISLITMWNIVNQLGKHDFSCASVVNNLKDMNFFLIIGVEIALTQF